MLADLVFYMFSGVMLLAALGVISARNPMYCVMLLILAFFNAAGLFILLGAEFIGLLLVMVYVGAVAVMFLFVLMTINIDFAVLKDGFAEYLPVGLMVGLLLVIELVLAVSSGVFSTSFGAAQASLPIGTDENIVAIGKVMFSDFLLPFQVSALVLLVAMIGAIVLTHRRRDDVRRQDIGAQLARRREDSVELVNVKPGQGI